MYKHFHLGKLLCIDDGTIYSSSVSSECAIYVEITNSGITSYNAGTVTIEYKDLSGDDNVFTTGLEATSVNGVVKSKTGENVLKTGGDITITSYKFVLNDASNTKVNKTMEM